MKPKHLIFIFIIIEIFLSRISFCQQNMFEKIDASVLNFLDDKTLIFRIKNLDTISYYIPKNYWISNIGDTLFVEAVYKKRDDSEFEILYNQFNPPEFIEVKPNTCYIRKILYRDYKIVVSNYVNIRIFNACLPYDPERDYEKYHSLESFLDYEKINSALLRVSIDYIEFIDEW